MKQNRLFKQSLIVISILLTLTFSACTKKLAPQRIVFNDQTELFEYQVNKKSSIPLRKYDYQLLDSVNHAEFMKELQRDRYNYPIDNRMELCNTLKSSDHALAELYSRSANNLNAGSYKKAIENIDVMEIIYPDILKFSDCAFLKAYAYDQIEMPDSAASYYRKFLNYSIQKYSCRLHGYRYADQNDSILFHQRDLAKERISSGKEIQGLGFQAIKPKFYYDNFLPGFSYNHEEYPVNHIGSIGFYFGISQTEMLFGFSVFYLLGNKISLYPWMGISRNLFSTGLAVPVQLYKSESNNFGVKFTPYIESLSFDEIKLDNNTYTIDNSYINFGARLSAGYFPLQRIMIGSYYQYNYYNRMHPFKISDDIYTWGNNEFDLSFYFHLLKGISLKTGLKNRDLNVGFLVSGTELSVNITHLEFIIRTNVF